MNRIIHSTTFLAIVACVLWSTAFAVIKIGLPYTSPLQFAGTRFILSGLMLLPTIRSLETKLRLSLPHSKKIIFIGFISIFLQYALFYTGFSFVPGAVGALVVGSGPLFVAVVAHFMMPGDSITRRKIVSILLGLAGVAVLSLYGRSISGTGGLMLLGILILLGNNLMAGFGNVIVSRDAQNVNPIVLAALSMISGGVLLFILGLLTEKPSLGPFPPEYYLSLVWLSFLSAAAISVWYTLLKRPGVKVSVLNMWKFIIPVLGAILSWIILPDESPTAAALLGMALISAALINMSLHFPKKPFRNKTPV